MQTSSDPVDRKLRKVIWAFTRDSVMGLPSSHLTADKNWHSALLSSVTILLTALEHGFGLKKVKNIGNKLSKKKLPNGPLIGALDLVDSDVMALRIDTVHKAKGESLDAVLYVATAEHAKAMLSGVGTELGRIGYVAVTRARVLLWVAVPQNALKELRSELLAHGFKEASAN